MHVVAGAIKGGGCGGDGGDGGGRLALRERAESSDAVGGLKRGVASETNETVDKVAAHGVGSVVPKRMRCQSVCECRT